MASALFSSPGTIPLSFQTEVKDGCPADCELCPEHKQHACLGITLREPGGAWLPGAPLRLHDS